jgi:hypothetical protein
MVQKANVGHGKTKDGQDGEKERLTLYSLSFNTVVAVVVFIVVVVVGGKIKVMKRQRRSE